MEFDAIDQTERTNADFAVVVSPVRPFDRLALEYPGAVIEPDATLPQVSQVLRFVPLELRWAEYTLSA